MILYLKIVNLILFIHCTDSYKDMDIEGYFVENEFSNSGRILNLSENLSDESDGESSSELAASRQVVNILFRDKIDFIFFILSNISYSEWATDHFETFNGFIIEGGWFCGYFLSFMSNNTLKYRS